MMHSRFSASYSCAGHESSGATQGAARPSCPLRDGLQAAWENPESKIQNYQLGNLHNFGFKCVLQITFLFFRSDETFTRQISNPHRDDDDSTRSRTDDSNDWGEARCCSVDFDIGRYEERDSFVFFTCEGNVKCV